MARNLHAIQEKSTVTAARKRIIETANKGTLADTVQLSPYKTATREA